MIPKVVVVVQESEAQPAFDEPAQIDEAPFEAPEPVAEPEPEPEPAPAPVAATPRKEFKPAPSRPQVDSSKLPPPRPPEPETSTLPVAIFGILVVAGLVAAIYFFALKQ